MLLLVVMAGGAIGLMLAKPVPPVVRVPVPAVAPVAAKAAPVMRDAAVVLRRDASGHFFGQAKVNGRPVRMLVDTGASVVALTPDDARGAGLPIDPARWRRIGRTASGDAVGEALTIASLSLGGVQRMDVEAVVVEGLPVSLLGQSFLSRLEAVEMRGDRMTLR